MNTCLFVALGFLALCAAQKINNPTAAAKAVYTPQNKFLARDNTGNFACKVDTVQVTMDVAGDEDKMIISPEDIEAYLSQTATLEWAHVSQFFFSSLDGRNDEKILGTGGGDLGEFIQALESYTQVTGVVLTAEEVEQLFSRYLKIMTRSKFFFETDEKAYRKLAIATGCQNLKIAEVADKRKKQAILDKFASPEMVEFIGDPYIKFLAANAEKLNINKDYITYAIQAFHVNLWKPNTDSGALCYLMVKGKLDPKALVHIKTPSYCVDQGLAPLISPQLCAGQTYIEHTDSVKLFRRELVQLIVKPGDNPQDVLAKYNTLAQGHLAKFWDTYVGLPSFTVNFSYSAPVLETSAQE